MNAKKVITYGSAVLLVVLLGALSGWYFFLRSRTAAVEQADAARGFGLTISSVIGAVMGVSPAGGPSSAVSSEGSGSPAGGGEGIAGGSGIGSQYPGPTAGAATGTTSPDAATSTAAAAGGDESALPRVSHAATLAVAGFGFMAQGDSSKLVWAERATGHVFSMDLKSGAVVRMTNTTRPKTYEAFFSGDRVIERTIADDGSIETFSGTLAAVSATTSAALPGATLEKDVLALSLSSAQKPMIFYLRTKGGATEGVNAMADGSKPQVVFSSSLSGWRPYVLSDGRLIVAQKAAGGVVGHAYEAGKDRSLSPLVAPAPGLSVLPRAWSQALIWSTVSGANVGLYSRASAKAETARFSVATIADKCAWAPPPASASAKAPGPLVAYCAAPKAPLPPGFLEAWYQGALHTQDAWWVLDASEGSARTLDVSGGGWDVHDPIIDPSGRWIAFRNGADDTLWLVRIAR